MSIARREFLIATAAVVVGASRAGGTTRGASDMYGLIGQIEAVPGERDALVAILLAGTAGMPGCLSYIVATDPGDENAIWITEVWEDETSHRASLSLPSVQEAIARGRPLIASFAESTVTTPVGGHGLVKADAAP